MFVFAAYDAGCTLANKLKGGFSQVAHALIAEEPDYESCDLDLASRLVTNYPDVFQGEQFHGLSKDEITQSVARRIYVAERELYPQLSRFRRGIGSEYDLARSLVDPLDRYDFVSSVPHQPRIR